MTAPSWVPPGLKQAPMPLLRVQAFVNTRDLDAGTDLLAGAGTAGPWLRAAGLLGPDAEVSEAALRPAREVRESIRALLIRNSGGEPGGQDDLGPLRDLAGRETLRLAVAADGAIGLAPAAAGRLADGLLGLLLTIRDAQQDGTWPRLRACGNPDCLWAFYDRSHSRQGSWCEMSSCGNLMKNRSLRARRRVG